jgi:hypothetical protein
MARDAREELKQLEDQRAPLAANSAIKKQEVILRHYEQQDVDWQPNIGTNFSSSETIPNPQVTYAYKLSSTQQRFWKRIWCADVGVAMLWHVRNVIDIRATLDTNEEFY